MEIGTQKPIRLIILFVKQLYLYVMVYEYIVYLWYVVMNLKLTLFGNILLQNIALLNIYDMEKWIVFGASSVDQRPLTPKCSKSPSYPNDISGYLAKCILKIP